MEVFLANDAGEYLEIGVTPEGRYYAALYKKDFVVDPPENPDGVEDPAKPTDTLVDLLEVGVEDVADGEDCPADLPAQEGQKCWKATVSIPADYLPATKITKYNMYLTDGGKVQAVKSSKEGQSFHNLDNFETIAITTFSKSALWKAAQTTDKDFKTT